MPVAAAGEVLIRVAASGVNRPDVLQRLGKYPVPPGASDLPGPRAGGHHRERRRRCDAVCRLRGRRPGLCAGERRRLCGVLRRAGRHACRRRHTSPTSRRPACRRPSSLSGRTSSSGAPAAGRDAPRPGRQQRHRCDRDPAGQGAWRQGHRHGGKRRQGGRLPGTRRRPRHQLQDAGLRRRGATHHREGGRRRPCSTSSPAITSRGRSVVSQRRAGSPSSPCRAVSMRTSMPGSCCGGASPSPGDAASAVGCV